MDSAAGENGQRSLAEASSAGACDERGEYQQRNYPLVPEKCPRAGTDRWRAGGGDRRQRTGL